MISERLKVAAKFLKGFEFLADCGTDHALLPIYAIKKGYIKEAIASDNKHQPLLSAKQNIAEHRMYGKIQTVIADGLSYLNLENDVDVVSILGMGGQVIEKILDNAYLYNIKRMVIQPNGHAEKVRAFLENHKWAIVDEVFMKENNHYYQIIVAEPGKMTLTAVEREFGPMILKNQSDHFVERIQQMIKQLDEAYETTDDQKTKEKLAKRIAFLKGALA